MLGHCDDVKNNPMHLWKVSKDVTHHIESKFTKCKKHVDRNVKGL
jgi:hypothetical protein